MKALKISQTVLLEKPASPHFSASWGARKPGVASCAGLNSTQGASRAARATPIRPITAPGRGSRISPTTTPANRAKYSQA